MWYVMPATEQRAAVDAGRFATWKNFYLKILCMLIRIIQNNEISENTI
jgi:hypothetical protein